MLSCEEVTQLVSESLDRELSLRQRVSTKMHLMMCRLCSRYNKQLAGLREAFRLHAMREEDIEIYPASLSSEARQRIKQALHHTSREPH
jgi:predicted anti-sigma-YlaC factor YlaD